LIRHLVLAAVAASLVSACSPGSGGVDAASDDPNVALRPLIAQWSRDLEASHSACANKVEGKGCQDFQVTCKAEHAVGPADSQKGVTAQVVAAMTFAGRNADGSTGKSGSAFALFSKTADGWSRGDAMPVNLQTCAPA
jgi:hypothetical protein